MKMTNEDHHSSLINDDIHLTAIFQDSLGKPVPECCILYFMRAKDEGGDGVSWPWPTSQTQLFTGRMPFLSSNQQCQSTEWGKSITFHGLAHHISPGVFHPCL